MKDIQQQKGLKRSLFKELTKSCGGGRDGKQEAQNKIRKYKKRNAIAYKGQSDDDSLSSGYEESQESLVGEIVECGTFISDLESQKEQNQKLMKQTLRDVSNI